MSHQPIQNSITLFGVIAKTPGLISRNNFVKHCFVWSAIAIMSWQDVTRSSVCSGVKECGTEYAHNFLFPKSSFKIRRTTVLGMFKDSVIILDAIRRSFFTKSSSAAMFTSVRLDFGRLLLSSSSTSSLPSWNRKHHLKRLIVSNPHSHEPFAPILLFLSQIDRFEAKFYGNPLFISTIHDV